MSVGRDYKKSGWKNNSKSRVRQRALLVITLLLIGVFASVLAYIKTHKPVEPAPAANTRLQSPDKRTAKQHDEKNNKNTKPKYEYYKKLEQREVVIRKDELNPKQTDKPNAKPGEKPRQAVKQAKSNATDQRRGYLIQVGAFSKLADAEKVRAKLALLGISAQVVKGNTDSNKVIHRVRIGPLSDSKKMQSMRKQLRSENIQSIAIPLK